MKQKNGFFRVGMAAFALTFMAILAGCASTGGSGGGKSKEYVPAEWKMEEAKELPTLDVSILWLNPDKEERAIPLVKSVADGKDGVAIRQYAESADAKPNTWYAFSAPERTEVSYYAYRLADSWKIMKLKGKGNEYVSAKWVMKVTTSEPNLKDCVDVTPSEKESTYERYNNEGVRTINGWRKLLGGFGTHEGEWVVFTSPGGTIYYSNSGKYYQQK